MATLGLVRGGTKASANGGVEQSETVFRTDAGKKKDKIYSN